MGNLEFISNTCKSFCKIYQKLLLILCLIILSTPQISTAIEVASSKYDTFITQALPDDDMSTASYLALSNKKGQYSITYLPFDLDAYKYGVNAYSDTIIDASLSFYIKEIPNAPKPNIRQSTTPDKIANNLIDSTEDKLESIRENIITIEVYAIIDDNTFVPYSKDVTVSWNGKNHAIAPKHDSQNYALDKLGTFKLGEIILDTNKFNYEDGDRIDFTSDYFVKFISLCLGIERAQNNENEFLTTITQIPNATIILKQESGKSEIFLYSADSFDEYNQYSDQQDNTKTQLPPISQKSIDDINNLVEDNPFKLSQEEINAHKNTIAQYYSDPKNRGKPLPIPSAAGSNKKSPSLNEYSQMQFIMRNQQIDNMQIDKILKQLPSEQIENEQPQLKPVKTKRDFRPKINFEFIGRF